MNYHFRRPGIFREFGYLNFGIGNGDFIARGNLFVFPVVVVFDIHLLIIQELTWQLKTTC